MVTGNLCCLVLFLKGASRPSCRSLAPSLTTRTSKTVQGTFQSWLSFCWPKPTTLLTNHIVLATEARIFKKRKASAVIVLKKKYFVLLDLLPLEDSLSWSCFENPGSLHFFQTDFLFGLGSNRWMIPYKASWALVSPFWTVDQLPSSRRYALVTVSIPFFTLPKRSLQRRY